MKKIAFLVLLSLTFFSCQHLTKDKYLINVEIKGLKKGKVYLQKVRNEVPINVDSMEVTGETFSFKGSVPCPEMYQLIIKSSEPKNDYPLVMEVFVENSEITIETSMDNQQRLMIKGSQTHLEYNRFGGQTYQFKEKREKIATQIELAKKAKNDSLVVLLNTQYSNVELEKRAFIKKYVEENPKSYVAAFLTYRYLSFSLEDEELNSLLQKFDTSLKSSFYYKTLQSEIVASRKVAIGKPAPDFSMPDSSNTLTSLASLKGKVVVLSFWASWSPTSLSEQNTINKFYTELKNKGLEVVGISLDREKKQWIKGLKSDSTLTFPQLCDLKGTENIAKKLYAIKTVPYTIVINKQGIIVEKGIFGTPLKNKIEELLK